MKQLIFSVLLLASVPAFADDTTRAAQVTVSVADQIRASHHGDYAELGNGHVAVSLPWGELIAFAGTYPDTRTTHNFGLHINGIPAGDDNTCERFVLAVAPRFTDVWIGDAAPSAIGESVYRNGHLDRAALAHACHATPSVGMDLIAH